MNSANIKALAALIALLILSCPLNFALAGDLDCKNPLPTPKGLIEGVEAKYLKTSSISAYFLQTSFFAGLDKREVSRGSVQFARPGKMNWDYQDPTPQKFVSDGATIYFFQPKLNQVTLTSFKEAFSSELPVTFLLGLGSLSKSFDALGVCKIDEGTLINLKPKAEDASLSSFTLLVDKTSLSPLGAKVVDLGGNETAILLVSPKFNTPIATSTFDFKIPKGVDIIDNRGPGNSNSTLSATKSINEESTGDITGTDNTGKDNTGAPSVNEENLVK